MGVDTNLYVRPGFDSMYYQLMLMSFEQVTGEVQIKQTAVPEMVYLNFTYEGDHRNLGLHFHTYTPLGPAVLLKLGANEQAVRIMRQIAERVGGILQPEDSSEQMEMIPGMLWEENGLAFHLRKAVVEGEVRDENDLDGLVQSVREWDRQHRRETERLFRDILGG